MTRKTCSTWSVLGFALLAFACSHDKNNVSFPENHIQYADFQTFPTPRTFDRPGTLFRVDGENRRQLVAELQVPIMQGKEVFSSYTQTESWNLKGVLNFLAMPSNDISFDSGIAARRNIKVTLSGGLRERTFDADIDSAIKKAHLAYRKDSKYYVIRETIAVSGIEYNFEGNDETVAKTTGQLLSSFSKLPGAKVDYSLLRQSHRSLNQAFQTPHRLFYVVERVTQESRGLFEADAIRTPVKDFLIWTEESR